MSLNDNVPLVDAVFEFDKKIEMKNHIVRETAPFSIVLPVIPEESPASVTANTNKSSPAEKCGAVAGSSSGAKKTVQFCLESNQFGESSQPVTNFCLGDFGNDNKYYEQYSSNNSADVLQTKSAVTRNTSPFRPGGRGSKMLAKAIEQSSASVGAESMDDWTVSEPQFVLCTGKTPCFAKVMSVPSPDSNSVFIQPLHPSVTDPSLLVPWDGHLWLAKSSRLHDVKVRNIAVLCCMVIILEVLFLRF